MAAVVVDIPFQCRRERSFLEPNSNHFASGLLNLESLLSASPCKAMFPLVGLDFIRLKISELDLLRSKDLDTLGDPLKVL